jgi:hypothetical protein
MSWQSKRTMTAAEFLAAIARLGMNIAEAGRFLGMSERQARRLAAGTVEVYTPVALLLRLMLRHREAPVVPAWDPEGN